MSEAPKLLPCPFCGSDEIDIDAAGNPLVEGPDDVWVICEGCGGSSQIVTTVEEATKLWNTRIPWLREDLVERQIKALTYDTTTLEEFIELGCDILKALGRELPRYTEADFAVLDKAKALLEEFNALKEVEK